MSGIGHAIGGEAGSDVASLEMHGRRGVDTGVEIRAGGPSRLTRDGLRMSPADLASFERAKSGSRYFDAVVDAARREGRPTP